MERYRKAVRKRLLPDIIVLVITVLVSVYCVIKLVNVPGFDWDAVIASFWVWGIAFLLPVIGVINLVCLKRRFGKVREVLPDVEELVENCTDAVSEKYFFLDKYLFCMKKPAVIEYSKVRLIHAVEHTHHYKGTDRDTSYILLITKDGTKYRLENFHSDITEKSGKGSLEDSRKVFREVKGKLKSRCRRSNFTTLDPAEYRRRQERNGEQFPDFNERNH